MVLVLLYGIVICFIVICNVMTKPCVWKLSLTCENQSLEQAAWIDSASIPERNGGIHRRFQTELKKRANRANGKTENNKKWGKPNEQKKAKTSRFFIKKLRCVKTRKKEWKAFPCPNGE